MNGLALLLLLLLGLVGPAHAAPDVGLYDAIGRPIALPAVKLPGGGADHLIAVCSRPAHSATPSPHSTSASTTPSSPRGGHVDLGSLGDDLDFIVGKEMCSSRCLRALQTGRLEIGYPYEPEGYRRLIRPELEELMRAKFDAAMHFRNMLPFPFGPLRRR